MLLLPRVKIRSITTVNQWIVRHFPSYFLMHRYCTVLLSFVYQKKKKKKEDHLEFELHVISDRNQFHSIDINDLLQTCLEKRSSIVKHVFDTLVL